MDIQERIKQIEDEMEYSCPVCGSRLYVTAYSDEKVTFHCSSDAAKFWTFERGTSALSTAKAHWDGSVQEVSIL